MATDLRNDSDVHLSTLLGGIIKDAQDLIKQEVALARSEFVQELNKTKNAAISLGLGIGVAALGGWLLILTVVYLLHEQGGLQLWLSYLVVGAVLTIIGVSLFFIGRNKASDIHLVPQQTMQTLKENVQWIKNQT